jgi:hypothetical protein
MEDKKEGLFIACYEIGTGKPGAQLFSVNLGVYTPEETVSGSGLITQTTNPPLKISVHLVGQYTYMCVMPKNCHILVTLNGYPIVKWPSLGGAGPVLQAVVELRMVLTDDWKSGTATYSYVDASGNKHEVKNVPVKQVTCKTIN